jgi:hypothetical protein
VGWATGCSADGSTVLAGAPRDRDGDDREVGAAYVLASE